MRRVLLPLALTVLIAITVGLILGGTVPSTGLNVEGTKLSQSQINTDLGEASSSNTYLCYLNATALVRSSGQSGLGSVSGSTTATYSSTFVTNWLDNEITNLIVSKNISDLGLSAQVTQDLQTAQSDLEASITATLNQVAGSQSQCAGTAATILGSLPHAFANDLVQAQANSEVLLAHEGGIGLDVQSLQNYYNASPTSFDTICISGILVSSQAKAASIRGQLVAGANFATSAAQNSIDASKANGGALGCFAPSSGNYAAVVKDVGSLAVAGFTQPLASQNKDYVVLTPTSRTTTPFASIVSAVRQLVLAKDAALAQKKATAIVRSASVTLDPRYGSWSATSIQTGVIPPGSPPANAVLNASANLPGASG